MESLTPGRQRKSPSPRAAAAMRRQTVLTSGGVGCLLYDCSCTYACWTRSSAANGCVLRQRGHAPCTHRCADEFHGAGRRATSPCCSSRRSRGSSASPLGPPAAAGMHPMSPGASPRSSRWRRARGPARTTKGRERSLIGAAMLAARTTGPQRCATIRCGRAAQASGMAIGYDRSWRSSSAWPPWPRCWSRSGANRRPASGSRSRSPPRLSSRSPCFRARSTRTTGG